MAEVDLLEMAEQLLKESVSHNRCCMNAGWRGRKCQYHQGFFDGMDVLIVKLVNMYRGGVIPDPTSEVRS